MIDRSEVLTLVPAAGRGSRLGGNCPKVFTPITEKDTIWSILYTKLKHISSNHCIILNSKTYEDYKDCLDPNLKVAFQDDPIGMGDAIFQGAKFFEDHRFLVVVWGDQVHVSQNTFEQVVSSYNGKENQIVLPLVKKTDPYVEYMFDNGILKQIKQQREGDNTSPGGLSDIGVFGLSITGLESCWSEFLQNCTTGNQTGEINFLPFLSFLSTTKKWNVSKIMIDDEDESRGINTQEDLKYFRDMYERT